MARSKADLHRRLLVVSVIIVLSVLLTAACSTGGPSASSTASIAPTPSSSAGEGAVLDWLTKAQAAAQGLSKYGFELQMTQQLRGKEAADHSDVKIDMLGRVERNPLKLDQTINSQIDNEISSLRSILVPDAYYMYLPEFEEWSKLSAEVSEENMETLSDFQVNPAKALEDIRALGSTLRAEQSGDVVTIRYEGVGPEAKAFLAGILESTMGLSGEKATLQDSLDITRLSIVLTLDANKHWPLSFRVESDMQIEFEPGHPTEVSQILAGTYSKHNASAPVIVPKEAQEAIDPDQMEEELDLELNLNAGSLESDS
jgi:hypothetical protein